MARSRYRSQDSALVKTAISLFLAFFHIHWKSTTSRKDRLLTEHTSTPLDVYIKSTHLSTPLA